MKQRLGAIHVPALTAPLAAIARHAGIDVAVLVAERLAGKHVAFPRCAGEWPRHDHGEVMLKLLGAAAQAVLDDIDAERQMWARKPIQIEIPAAKSTRAAILYNRGYSVEDIAHALLMSRRWVGLIIRQNAHHG